MSEKRTQNKFRDLMGDYYKTNRQVSEAQRDKDERGRRSNSREKSMIIILAILIIILILKSCVFDEVKNLTREEQQFKDFVEYSVQEEYGGGLADLGLIVYRVYDIYLADPNEKGMIRYEDKKTGTMVDLIQEGRYNARVRGYLLWIIPIKHFSVTAQVKE